ncbi:TonB-dependent receptor domain-containing protein [Nitrincola nitratireducens]|uniref:Putative hemoglobin and hemoglobin-haptoglobin-binding protein 2 n=2 Tax=Nitrincola TaxID=267849 RepID=W9UXZ4_9GAMM|nr:TonB-dependent receptor [Nitrincola nitratireducens]EXJ09596.1 putative hemoglobin and hemoglobin-haptoglobin-binding protein 2 precursor [Nitrincola nitratireducens]
MNWFAQYSEGFRAPTPGDVNSGFTNLSSPFFAYRTIANPDLKPESSKMYEVGLRGRDETLNYSVSLFRSDYKNFIENAEVSGTGRPSDPLTYQSVNRDGVEVTGIEASLRWKYHPNWALSGTYAKHRGHRKEDGEKVNLDTIDPAKLVAGLHFDNGRYGSELIMTHVEAKRRNSRADGFNPGRYTTFDLLGSYQLSRNASLQAGIFNLTDESYTHWADVRSLNADSQVVDAFTQPGRNFKVSFTYQF